jgi:pimeloyl-ACP methyl ester carboxylesterase
VLITPRRLELQGVEGLTLAADAYGTPGDQVVLLFHGGGQTRHAWRGTAARLAAQSCYSIAVDMRGHGDSEWSPTGHYELEQFAGDVSAVALAHHQPVLVGASLGGIASLLAIGEADRPIASGLVLVDIVTRPAQRGVDRIREFMRQGFDGFESIEAVADAIATYLPHRTRPTDLSGLLKNVRQRADGLWVWHWDPAFFARVERDTGEPTAGSFSPPDRLDDAARRITVPTLLVRGGDSDVVSAQGAADLLTLIPHAEGVEVPGAGHMVAGDQNDKFTDAVAKFIDGLAPAAR